MAWVDVDGWHVRCHIVRDLIALLFFNDKTDFHRLIRDGLILPYLAGSFHTSFIEDYA